MSLLALYAIFVLIPNTRDLCQGIMAIGGFLWIIFCIFGPLAAEDGLIKKSSVKMLIVSGVIVLSFAAILITILPSDKQMMLLAGGYAVTNDAELKLLPDNILKAANDYLGTITKEEPAHAHK